jgi:hypothetical protein
MRKTFCVFTLILCAAVNATAQNTDPSVIASASGSGKTSNFSLEWTLGEYAVETISSPGIIYTQGFNQPHLIVSPVFSKLAAGVKSTYNISIAPNPVVSTLNFNFNATKEMDVILTVTDVHGRPHLQRRLGGKFTHTQLNFIGLPAGTYVLSVRDATSAQLLKSYQIIKL